MSESCDHLVSEPADHDITGDTVSRCCDCEAVLGPVSKGEIPAHWYDHEPERRAMQQVRLAREVLNGAVPNPPGASDDERFIQICGGCGHWLGAVHGRYFDNLSAPYDVSEDPIPGFIDGLMESLCPRCNGANFRDTSTVVKYSTAKWIDESGFGIPNHVLNRADRAYWHGKRGGPEEHLSAEAAIGMPMRYLHDYYVRCPCCGYAEAYAGREFDFHHWEYDDDTGCRLCRKCHQHIHRGVRAAEQNKETGDWKRDAMNRLHARSLKNGLSFKRASDFINRYNIPATPERLQWLQEVVGDE